MGCSSRSLRNSVSVLVVGCAWYAITSTEGSAALETATVRLSPQDTFLNLNATNYSSNSLLMAYTWPDNQVSNAVVMKFDLSALPAGATIQDARLNLALIQSDLSLDLTYTVTAHKLLGRNPVIAAATGYTADGVNPWTANACCSNNIPMAQANLSPAYATRAVDKIPGFKVWNVTTMVQEWMQTPAENFGLLLNADTTKPRDRYRYFASMENLNVLLRPFLEVTYSTIDATPPSVAVTAPANGTTVSGLVPLEASATDNLAVAGVQFLIDGTPVGAEQVAAPYRLDWDSTTSSDGTHTITALARDTAGNTATSAGRSVTVENGIVILQPQDTFLNLDTVNYSTSPTLATYTWPDFKAANAILMRFNLSGVPAGAIVQEAKLYLNLVDKDASPDATYAVAVHKIVVKNPAIATATGYTADGATAWTPNACCHNGVPLAQADLSAAYDTQAIDKTAGFKSWTITGLVQEWLLQPATNLGLLLNSDTSKAADRYRSFASMENPTPSKRPYLRVAYSLSSDSTPPTVAVTSPPQSALVTGVTTLAANATDNVGVAGVQFKVDGAPIGVEDTAPPYERAWDTSGVSAGEHTITATARDVAGNVSTSTAVTVTVANDTTAPTVSISAPAGGATVSGTLTVAASASDNVGVVGVQFTLDGANLGAEDTTAPFSVSWNSTTAANGSHTLTAVARDAGGNTTTSTAVTVTVANDPDAPTVSISAPAGGATVSGTLTVSASASDNVGVLGVQFKLDGTNLGAEDTTSPYSRAWNTTTTANGSHTLTAVARDAAGNTTTSTAVTVTVANDTTAPTVSISAPAGGATVSGTLTVAADASDNVGVVGVQFKLDGANLGTEDTTSPYSVSWNTTTATDGSHSLTAVARDAAGNQLTSAAVTVTVSNAPPPPPPPPSGGIAALYPGDVGIENHADVVLVERFEDASLTSVFGRWTDVLNGSRMALVSDVPAGSPGTQALNIPWEGGGLNNGGHLYKLLSSGVDDTLYVRYYIKYPASGQYRHAGMWMGGSNPASAWPNPQAGVKPAGNDRFIAAAEPDIQNSRFDHYDYWMNMRQSSDGSYWGNRLLNDPDVDATRGQWMCVEHMVKLNNPVSASNGEHAIWLDGVMVSHVGQGFPNGSWSGGTFTQNPLGSPFEGLRWRSDANLQLNWLWLQNYSPDDPIGFSGTMLFDHVVAAKTRVGCLVSGSGSDVIAPAVALSAPAAGATVSGSIAVSASASDNVGVVGVQFKMDGVNLGAEDTIAPFSIPWDTTTAPNGSHTLTAVARDAAGNTSVSAGRSVTVSNGSSPGDVIFDSSWDTATGTGANAVTDGGRWHNYWEFGDGQLLSVVSGGVNGHNALRVQQRGSSYAANTQIDNFLPQSADYYLRFYMRNDDTSSTGDHIVTVDTWEYANLTFMRKFGGATSWDFVISLYGCGYVYPIGHWRPAVTLTNGEWYRFEYHVDFTDATHIRVHPRVYDAEGTLIASDANFRQSDFGTASWNGRSDWTLASYYAAGHNFCVNPAWVNELGLGNNGQQGAANTGRYWYFSGVQIRTDTWPGAIAPR